mmetsp:Transcript_1362/g.3028  ORF Transcript_1362/g.3028 Transcript_1362/m.3028 type:complete len:118 (+) Transcript_1362:245-598(+)
MRMDVDDEPENTSSAVKLQSSLQDVVSVVDLFALLTEELAKGVDCSEASVSEKCLSIIDQLKSLQSTLAGIVPFISKEVEFRNDSYLESKRLELGMDKLSIYREHIRKMKEIAEQMA